ncbi:hypothetical protein OOK12_22560 [Streptomyces sp. NBC_00452]|uniref:hypothetical protein n=1 Tax=Streptomyces sp. NBC_00452 TaxID=2975746 RepID=UPI0022531008|nr:hypothetical protein [Streptomyces sp. NBC_00452]MCX5059759.1 hypothetical protein [Streptomyces sp. NBC_00452]
MRITTCLTSEIVPVAALRTAASVPVPTPGAIPVPTPVAIPEPTPVAIPEPTPVAMPAATVAPKLTKPLRLIGVIRPVLVTTGVPGRHTAARLPGVLVRGRTCAVSPR